MSIDWQAFQSARLRDLQEAWQLGTTAVQQGRLPEQVPQNAALTAGAVLALVGSVLLVPRLRRLVWNTVDTTLAVLLLAFLVLFVLLLPPSLQNAALNFAELQLPSGK